jgi:putative transposase
VAKHKQDVSKIDQVIDALLEQGADAEDLFGQDGLLKQLTKKLTERMLEAELTDHLGYEKHAPEGYNNGNSRNGKTTKTLKSERGNISIDIPRDRDGSFDPKLIRTYQTRWPDFDEKIISMYGRGMSVREIQGHIEDLYGVEVSADLVSQITDSVLDEVRAWQARALDAVYPIMFLDALFVKVRDAGSIKNKAVYLALGINMAGDKELLGLWIEQSEGAKFWLSVLTELKNRGVCDIFIACCDGLSGFAQAIETVYPKTTVQLCIVHLVRASLTYVSYKDRQALARDLKAIYQAKTLEQAEMNLEIFAQGWDERYPTISRQWRKLWDHITPFFAFPEQIRKVIYTTNAIESMNRGLRKIIKTRGAFPSDDAVKKLLYLALLNLSKRWTRPIANWSAAINQFVIMYEDRVPMN